VRERERERENDFECDEYGSCHYGTRIERLQGIRSKYVFYFVYVRFARGIILTESCRFLFLKKKTEWTAERVGAFVAQECMLPEYKQLFVKHSVTGKIVGLLTKQDLIDMGITKIGHQIRLLTKFKPFQAAQSAQKRLDGVQSWTEFVWPWHCMRYCYPRKFKLTQSGLRIRQDFWCGTFKFFLL